MLACDVQFCMSDVRFSDGGPFDQDVEYAVLVREVVRRLVQGFVKVSWHVNRDARGAGAWLT